MSKTILLADDSLTIQKVVELTFSDSDFEVVSTSSGDELLEKLAVTNPDLIICDTIMPGTDGYQVCQTIKSNPDALHIPVVLLTGTFEPFDRDRALAAGCSEIITKPFEARKLVETVEHLAAGKIVAPSVPDSIEGAIPPPLFSPAATDPADVEDAPSEFGTMLSPPAEMPDEAIAGPAEDGLDFTATGFADMEAAGREVEATPQEAPAQGLDFQFGDDSSAADTDPERTPLNEIEEAEPTQPASQDEIQAATDENDEEEAEQVAASPFDDDQPNDPPVDQTEEEAPPVPVPLAPEDDVVAQPEVETPETGLPEAEAPEPETSDADTSPVVGPLPEAAPILLDEPEESNLSEADIDRIARRVVELTSDRLEQIAWEVIPDMAELVVRERVRDIEAEIEGSDRSTDAN